MKKYIFAILVLSLALFVYGCSHQTTEGSNANQQVSTPTQTVQETESNVNDQQQTTQPKETIPTKTANTYSLDISNFAFSPKEIRIKQGDIVVWTNKDSAKHTVTSDSGSELDSQYLPKGESYSHTFSKTGTFTYHCTPHPSMKARIIVE